MKKIWMLLFSTSLFAASVEDRSNLKIETPSLQCREQRKIRLDNGLEALLISDPETPSSGAALAVSVGTWDDPQEHPGMAHFVEHLLFLGTKRYPEEEGYTRYLDEHGGMRNAFTMADRTCYIFSVNNEGFSEALDRFGHFFIDPLFSQSGVERECKAIHQEYCSYIPLDNWRSIYVKKELANPRHPFHTFCIGNLDTIGQIPHAKVRDWYDRYYSSDCMHLVVLSTKPMPELEAEVSGLFSHVPLKRNTQTLVMEPLFTPEAQGTFSAIYPVQAVQQLEILWEIPRRFGQDMETHIEKLVAHVLGHEGQTSLLAQLKREQLADALSVGMYHAGQRQGFLTLSVGLTDVGVKHYEKVLKRVHEGLASLRESGIPRYIFEEVATIEEMEYRFQSRDEVFNFVSQWAAAMVDEELETFPRKSLIPTRYDSDKVNEFLALLQPDTAIYSLVCPQQMNPFPADRKERWLGASYSLRSIPQKKIDSWKNAAPHTAIAIPDRNPFMPQDLECRGKPISSAEIPHPTKVVDNSWARVYSCADDRYLVPQICWHIDLATPLVSEGDAKSQVLADLYCHAVAEKLNPVAYDALMAGLVCNMETARKGIAITIEGYSDKAAVFLATILETMKDCVPTKEQFNQYKQLARRDYANQANLSSLRLGMERLRDLLYAQNTSAEAKAKAVERVRYHDLVRFSNNVWNRCFAEATLFGNQTKGQSEEVVELLSLHFSNECYPPEEHPKVQVAALSDVAFIKEPTRLPSNAVILTMDLGDFSFERRAAQEILSKGLEEPFFSELRTRQQTAYLVSSWSQELERRLFSFFAIQSSTHETRDLLARFELFLESSLQHLTDKTIPESRFEAIRVACIDRLENPAENMSKMGAILHKFATEYDADFDWLEQRKAALRNLTYPQFVRYAEEFLGKQNHGRLAICIDGELPENQRFRYTPVETFETMRKRIEYKAR